MENLIVKLLFQTKAIQVCEENKPFWYTSGSLGPYYINTHYLYGSKQEAEDLLSYMEEISNNKETYPSLLFKKMLNQYQTNEIFKNVMDMIVEKSKEIEFDFISGGERRDFFFSIIAAYLLKKPHISIFKDMSMVVSDSDFNSSSPVTKDSFKGQKSLHIADLVTEASSYLRAWIPAIDFAGGVINDTIAIVDRDQGGYEALLEKGITLHSFALIQKDLFNTAKNGGYISEAQLTLILQFIESPKLFMKTFIENNPTFIEEQINAGGKSKERALLFLEKKFDK